MKLNKISEVWNSADRLLSDFGLLSSKHFATMATDATTSTLYYRKRPNKRPGGGVYLILGVQAEVFNR